MDSVKWIDVVSAVAASVSALAVILAMLQLRTTKAINQLEFEDGLDKEYRDLVARIPTKALLGSGLSPREYRDAIDELYRYFDLCNQQVFLRKRKRISLEGWVQWCAGIQYNLESLPTFKRAWNDTKSRCDSFKELRKSEEKKFKDDPANWDND